MNSKGYIYCLLDPKSGHPKYIGQTSVSVESRVYDHLRCVGRTKKSNWIKSLLRSGYLPESEILDVVDVSELNFWEMHYISLYRSWGFDLKNQTLGGDGVRGFKSPPASLELRQKRSLLMKQRRPMLKDRMIELGSYKKIAEKNRLNGNFDKTSNRMRKNNPMHNKEIALKAARAHSENFENPILQYSIDGEFIKEWKSVSACYRELNISTGNIHSVLTNKTSTAGGFYWMKKCGEIKQKVVVREKNKYHVPVLQYDLDGNFIKEWHSVSEPSLVFVNKNKSSITDAINGRINSAFGYMWRYKTDNFPKKIDKIGESNLIRRKVSQYDLGGSFIKEYRSVREAQVAMNGKNNGSVSEVLRGVQKKAYGYLWK